jgi:hypothetical protein
MIHVQIASQLTADGVHGVRWVLLEAAEVSAEAEAEAATTSGTAHAALVIDDATPPTSADAAVGSLRLRLLKGLVVALGLGAAVWTAVVQIGPPGRTTVPAIPVPAPAASTPKAAVPTVAARASAALAPKATSTTPSAQNPSAAQPPLGPASASLSRLTASL